MQPCCFDWLLGGIGGTQHLASQPLLPSGKGLVNLLVLFPVPMGYLAVRPLPSSRPISPPKVQNAGGSLLS